MEIAMSKAVCFGEIMGRLNPAGYLRFVQAENLEITYAGGEANVSVSLANYGHDVSFVTKLPKNELGQSAVNALRRFGVDTSKICRGGERLASILDGKRRFPAPFQGDLRPQAFLHCRRFGGRF